MELLEDNPSLKSYLETAIDKAYQKAVALAARETDLPYAIFPVACPHALEDSLSSDFYPGIASQLLIDEVP